MVAEDGSELAAELWSVAQPAVSSILSYPEARAALALAHRLGRLTSRAHTRAVEDFDTLHRELTLVGVDQALAGRAGELAEELDLRGYEAVHLASALALDADVVTVVTWDRALGRAATQGGCAVAPTPPARCSD